MKGPLPRWLAHWFARVHFQIKDAISAEWDRRCPISREPLPDFIPPLYPGNEGLRIRPKTPEQSAPTNHKEARNVHRSE